MLHITPGLTAYILFITFLLGCCLGSFSDCLAMRLLSGESAFSGRSHCDNCGHVLGVADLIPLFSWLFLKGKCRYCGAKVPAECFFTELIAGIGCCLIVYRYDLSIMSLRCILLGLILLILTITDLHEWIIPDRLQIAGCLVFLERRFSCRIPYIRYCAASFLDSRWAAECCSYPFSLTGLPERKAWEAGTSNCFL